MFSFLVPKRREKTVKIVNGREVWSVNLGNATSKSAPEPEMQFQGAADAAATAAETAQKTADDGLSAAEQAQRNKNP